MSNAPAIAKKTLNASRVYRSLPNVIHPMARSREISIPYILNDMT